MFQIDPDYDRESFSLYLTGLLPHSVAEANAVLALCGRLLPILQESRQARRLDGEEG